MNRETSRTVYLALGCNIGNKQSQLEKAIAEIAKTIGNVAAQSKFYLTRPLNPPENPHLNKDTFLNAVISCRSQLSAIDILTQIKEIERKLGRNPSKRIHWSPREIDIDIIAVDNEIIDLPNLKIPHVEFRRRDFVLCPLREVAPNFVDPVSGSHIDFLIREREQLGLPNLLHT